jgi:serine/threonine protein kinase
MVINILILICWKPVRKHVTPQFAHDIDDPVSFGVPVLKGSLRWDGCQEVRVPIYTRFVNLCGGFAAIVRPLPPNLTATYDYKFLGEGSFGKVFLFRRKDSSDWRQDVQLPHKFVLKMQTDLGTKDRDFNGFRIGSTFPFIVTLLRDGDLEWSEKHPPLVYEDRSSRGKMLQFPDRGTKAFAIMLEYAEEGCLADYIGTIGTDVTWWRKTSRRFVAEMLLALEFLHKNNIIHRDLKPENTLIFEARDRSKHVKLSDFGHSKQVTLLSLATTIAGSPSFAAPEMQIKYNNRDCRKPILQPEKLDVFSLGVTMFVMLAVLGKSSYEHGLDELLKLTVLPPFGGPDPEYDGKVFMKHLYDLKPTHCSEEVRNFITRCTRKEPEERPRASELLNDPLFKAHSNLTVIKWDQLRQTKFDYT